MKQIASCVPAFTETVLMVVLRHDNDVDYYLQFACIKYFVCVKRKIIWVAAVGATVNRQKTLTAVTKNRLD